MGRGDERRTACRTMVAMDDVAITGDTIRLGQLLKLANLIDQGADAKLLLAQDQVTVNGDVETRRGRQLVRGDVVSVGETSVRVS
jgi:ribosome-associated protein